MASTPTILRGFTTWPFRKAEKLSHEGRFHLFLARALWIGVTAVAVASILDALKWPPPSELNSVVSHLIGGLGEAFLIAYVVAVAVEPYMQKWYATQLSRAMWWAVHREGLPDGVRRSIEDLASSEEVYRAVNWAFDFTWADESHQQVRIEIKLISRGLNIDAPNLHPPVALWMTDSVPPYESHYLRWEMDCPALRDAPWSVEGEDIKKIEKGERLASSFYPDNVYVPVGQYYTIRKEAVIYPERNMVPLRVRCLAERMEYRIEGEAAHAFSFTMKHPNSAGTMEEKRMAGQQRYISFQSPRGECCFPGHVAILAWKRITDHPSTPEAVSTVEVPGQ
ncbi:hypothetical protein ACH49O_27535 [Streptomyces coeruleorubidus]|uniref:hypothetical protein n=1 Tax=Streptomyces coeruleorubidus TaxID=116188 RepID=UPI0033F3B813